MHVLVLRAMCQVRVDAMRDVLTREAPVMRDIPSIEQLRQRPAMLALEEQFGRTAVVEALREEASAFRGAAAAGRAVPEDVAEAILLAVPGRLAASR